MVGIAGQWTLKYRYTNVRISYEHIQDLHYVLYINTRNPLCRRRLSSILHIMVCYRRQNDRLCNSSYWV